MVLTLDNKPLLEPYTIMIPEISFDRFLEFANEDISCELLDGVLIIHSPASFEHESIFKFLLILLELYSNKKSLGTPIGSHFVMKLSRKWVPEPDIIFLTPEDQKMLTDTYLDGPASVVFEILSNSNRLNDLEKKLPKYLEAGVKEVWIIDPKEKHISIHTSKNVKTFRDDQWAKSEIITGFRVKNTWLWSHPMILVETALREI